MDKVKTISITKGLFYELRFVQFYFKVEVAVTMHLNLFVVTPNKMYVNNFHSLRQLNAPQWRNANYNEALTQSLPFKST